MTQICEGCGDAFDDNRGSFCLDCSVAKINIRRVKRQPKQRRENAQEARKRDKIRRPRRIDKYSEV